MTEFINKVYNNNDNRKWVNMKLFKKRAKKGLTLIELLAVIVILAIISVITIPVLLNVVEKSRLGSKESSMIGYVDALEKQVIISKVKGGDQIEIGIYSVEQLTDLGVNVKGENPETGVFVIDQKGHVSEGWATYEDGKYKVYYNGKKAVASNGNDYIDESGNTHNDMATPGASDNYIPQYGTIDKSNVYSSSGVKQKGVKGVVYLDPINLSSTCDATNAIVGSGTNGCMKWYIYDDDGASYKMILDHNTAEYIEKWDPNTTGTTWQNSAVEYENSAPYVSVQSLGWNNSLNVSILSTDELNKITGKTGYDARVGSTSEQAHLVWEYYLDSLSSSMSSVASQGASAYAWLFDYTNGCTSYGCNVESTNTRNLGYWLQTSPIYPGMAYTIFRKGNIHEDSVIANYIGVRPVIEVPKVLSN